VPGGMEEVVAVWLWVADHHVHALLPALCLGPVQLHGDHDSVYPYGHCDSFRFDHRASAPCLAMARRRARVRFFARALPPRAPRAAAAAFRSFFFAMLTSPSGLMREFVPA